MVLYTSKMNWKYESRPNHVWKKWELNIQSIFQNKFFKVRFNKYEKNDFMLPLFFVSNTDLKCYQIFIFNFYTLLLLVLFHYCQSFLLKIIL